MTEKLKPLYNDKGDIVGVQEDNEVIGKTIFYVSHKANIQSVSPFRFNALVVQCETKQIHNTAQLELPFDLPSKPKFEVGDSVYCVVWGNGEVVSVTPNSLYVYGVRFGDNWLRYFYREGGSVEGCGQLELKANMSLFDVGDRVKCEGREFKVGDIVYCGEKPVWGNGVVREVTPLDDGASPYKVIFENSSIIRHFDGKGQHLSGAQLELKANMSLFDVGDRVKCEGREEWGEGAVHKVANFIHVNFAKDSSSGARSFKLDGTRSTGCEKIRLVKVSGIKSPEHAGVLKVGNKEISVTKTLSFDENEVMDTTELPPTPFNSGDKVKDISVTAGPNIGVVTKIYMGPDLQFQCVVARFDGVNVVYEGSQIRYLKKVDTKFKKGDRVYAKGSWWGDGVVEGVDNRLIYVRFDTGYKRTFYLDGKGYIVPEFHLHKLSDPINKIVEPSNEDHHHQGHYQSAIEEKEEKPKLDIMSITRKFCK